MSLAVNGAGVLSLSGKGVVAVKATSRGAETVTALVRAAKSKQAALKGTAGLKTKLAIRFTPDNGGASAAVTKPITLRKHSR